MLRIASGETTVRVTGSGRGGRNQEFALALVERLAAPRESGAPRVVAASIGTDGIDGPTDAAGGMVDSTTLRRARDAGIGEPAAFLANNDAYHFLEAVGGLIRRARPIRTSATCRSSLTIRGGGGGWHPHRGGEVRACPSSGEGVGGGWKGGGGGGGQR